MTRQRFIDQATREAERNAAADEDRVLREALGVLASRLATCESQAPSARDGRTRTELRIIAAILRTISIAKEIPCGQPHALATLAKNIITAGALHAARIGGIEFCDGNVGWRPGCGRPHVLSFFEEMDLEQEQHMTSREIVITEG